MLWSRAFEIFEENNLLMGQISLCETQEVGAWGRALELGCEGSAAAPGPGYTVTRPAQGPPHPQPLSQSFSYWRLMYQQPDKVLRYVSFVEIMAPIFTMRDGFYDDFIVPTLYDAYTGNTRSGGAPFLT